MASRFNRLNRLGALRGVAVLGLLAANIVFVRLPDCQGSELGGLVIYALQVIASSLWLARFRFGPLEWLWRCASYGVRQPLLAERS